MDCLNSFLKINFPYTLLDLSTELLKLALQDHKINKTMKINKFDRARIPSPDELVTLIYANPQSSHLTLISQNPNKFEY